jgi:hypothetical protein
LCKNIQVVPSDNRKYIEHVIVKLILNKYQLSEEQQIQCFKCLEEKKIIKQEEGNIF